MRNWTESFAIAWINKATSSIIDGKTVLLDKRKGVGGLKACSAVSYLVSHCGYRTALARR